MTEQPYLTYLNFDLAIEALATAAELAEANVANAPIYRARVLYSPAGQANIDFMLPFNAHELENYILKMGRPRRSVRSLNTAEGLAARDFGSRLYNAIFRDEVRDALRRSLDAADAKPDHGLRIRLRLGDAPALLDLPWEYLYDPVSQRYLALSDQTPIVRYLALPQVDVPLAVDGPLRILVLTADANDYAKLDISAEADRLRSALQPLEAAG